MPTIRHRLPADPKEITERLIPDSRRSVARLKFGAPHFRNVKLARPALIARTSYERPLWGQEYAFTRAHSDVSFAPNADTRRSAVHRSANHWETDS